MSNLTDFFPAAGGGGGTPVGGYSFLQTPTDATFVSGQEVYTAADSTVWIKTEATITSAGSGVLDADNYIGKSLNFLNNGTAFTTISGYQDRTCFGYNGEEMIDCGYQAASGTSAKSFASNLTATGSLHYPGTTNFFGVNINGVAGSKHFGNATHAFTGFVRNSENRFRQNGQNFAYQPYTAIGGLGGYSGTTYFVTPTNNQMAVSHIQTTARYWGINGSNLQEYTFNASATNGSNPFSSTGSSISVNSGTLMSDGVDKLYVYSGTTVYEYSITGQLLNTFTGISSIGLGGNGEVAMVCIPPFRSLSGGTEFVAKTASGWNVSSPSGTPTYSRFLLTNLVSGPEYISSGGPVILEGTGDVDIVDAGQGVIYLWKRIA